MLAPSEKKLGKAKVEIVCNYIIMESLSAVYCYIELLFAHIS